MTQKIIPEFTKDKYGFPQSVKLLRTTKSDVYDISSKRIYMFPRHVVKMDDRGHTRAEIKFWEVYKDDVYIQKHVCPILAHGEWGAYHWEVQPRCKTRILPEDKPSFTRIMNKLQKDYEVYDMAFFQCGYLNGEKVVLDYAANAYDYI